MDKHEPLSILENHGHLLGRLQANIWHVRVHNVCLTLPQSKKYIIMQKIFDIICYQTFPFFLIQESFQIPNMPCYAD